ncbi:hypothetical protein MMC25_005974 [Agyrium rufum]|nr:hypothetical protein [Agyrium rufum]
MPQHRDGTRWIVSLLPETCPGCGAYSQFINAEEAGFYSITRKPVKAYVAAQRRERALELESISDAEEEPTESRDIRAEEVEVQATTADDVEKPQEAIGSADTKSINAPHSAPPKPICNRCHHLLHHRTGVPIIHPSISSIQSIFSESPHAYNHVYHVLDAADFPLSLIPSIHQYLALTPQRSQNRRAKTSRFTQGGRKAELSFVITRADLLAPKKEQVDAMMPLLTEVLRDALGKEARDVRLGNVRCVSAKRGWWTRKLKEDIYARGGGGWMVGKVNVGKSALFENVFPKGYGEAVNFERIREASIQRTLDMDDDLTLLPPSPAFTPYPTLPIVSSLPGTTASPIRLPFGQGKGELIDLPGLPRRDLAPYVLPEHQESLVMTKHVTAEQQVIRPGQSLLLGGLIRIQLADSLGSDDCVLLAAPFVNLSSHVGSTEKLAAVQSQELESNIASIAAPGIDSHIQSAGTFKLEWDVTKQRSGILTAPRGMGFKAKELPYVIYSADILIEGCGWVECAVQVRKRKMEERENQAILKANDGFVFGAPDDLAADAGEAEQRKTTGGTFNKPSYTHGVPVIEVFSPEGKGVGIRRPLGAYMLGGQAAKISAGPRARAPPRRSMKGAKKAEKVRVREERAKSSVLHVG